MRTDTAARQASKLEAILAKALLNMPASPNDGQTAAHVAEISTCLLEAYALGGLEVLERAPFEYQEVAYRDRVTVEALNRQGTAGWEAWALTEVMLPPHVGAPASEHQPGQLVRYRRRRAPVEVANDKA